MWQAIIKERIFKYNFFLLIIFCISFFTTFVFAQSGDNKPSEKWVVDTETRIHSVNKITTTNKFFYNDKHILNKIITSMSRANFNSTSTVEYYFDENGRQTKLIHKSVTGKVQTESVTLTSYDSNNHINKLNNTTRSNDQLTTMTIEYVNNDKGKPIKTVTSTNNGPPSTILTEYDQCGNISKYQMSNNIGTETKYEYMKDKDCLILGQVMISRGQVVSKEEFEYTSNDKVKRSIKTDISPIPNQPPRKTVTDNIYDENDNLVKSIMSDGTGKIIMTTTKTYIKLK